MIDVPPYGPVRKHQREAIVLANQVIGTAGMSGSSGGAPRSIKLAHVTPGGGKTLMCALYAQILIAAGLIDRVIWLVPRDSLRSQVVLGFHVHERGLSHELKALRTGDGMPNMKQGDMARVVGVCTTFAAVAANPKKFANFAGKGRCLFISDECHHCPVDGIADIENEEGAWTAGAAAVLAKSAHALLGTGTLGRSDGKRIAFVKYDEDSKPIVDIRYTRAMAIAERAVRVIKFYYRDGVGSYQHLGERHEVQLSTAPSKKTAARAVRAAVAHPSEYRDNEVSHVVEHWKRYRKTTGYSSRLIIIAATQDSAEYYAKFVAARYGLKPTLAISRDPDASRKIQQFRNHPEVSDTLITVGMAHEGLDVPDCTHLLCLTVIRSEAWLEQAFARVTRFDSKSPIPYEDQTAFIFVPDDPEMNKVVSLINATEIRAVEERAEGESKATPRGPSSYIAEGAIDTTLRYGEEDIKLSEIESDGIRRMIEEVPEFEHKSVSRQLELAYKFKYLAASSR
ncbi:MAG: DEAD/DEAH box helicase [Polyangiales bacterium]